MVKISKVNRKNLVQNLYEMKFYRTLFVTGDSLYTTLPILHFFFFFYTFAYKHPKFAR